MEIQELHEFLSDYTRKLNAPGFGYRVETSQTSQSVEVSFYSTEEHPDLLIITDSESVRVVYNGKYETLQEQTYKTRLELFQLLTQLITPMYSDFSLAELLSILLSYHVSNWKTLVEALVEGLPLTLQKEPHSLLILGERSHKIKVIADRIELDSFIEMSVQFQTLEDLFIALLSILNYILADEQLDIVVYTTDSSLIQDELEMGEGQTTGGTEINIDQTIEDSPDSAGNAESISDVQEFIPEETDDFTESSTTTASDVDLP